MIRTAVRSIAGIALTVAVAVGQGCSDATSPDAFVGTYQLERYEGLPLPAVRQQTSAGSLSVVSELLVVGNDGSALMSTTVREVSAQTPQGANQSYTSQYRYVVRGSSIELTFVCPPNANCIVGSPIVASRTSGGLATARRESSKPASFYRRIRADLI
jgi:hypothetical protein